MTIKEESKIVGIDEALIRRAHHNLRCKGYGVIGSQKGMYKSYSPSEKMKQAEKLIKMAADIQEAAEGLLKGELGELDEIETVVWNLLPEKRYVPEVYQTEFEEIEVRDGKIV